MQKCKSGNCDPEVSAIAYLQRRNKHCKGFSAYLGHRQHPHAAGNVVNLERALACFYAAVAEQYGQEEAVKAAQDWIEKLQKSESEVLVNWRSLASTAADRLARRVAKSTQA